MPSPAPTRNPALPLNPKNQFTQIFQSSCPVFSVSWRLHFMLSLHQETYTAPQCFSGCISHAAGPNSRGFSQMASSTPGAGFCPGSFLCLTGSFTSFSISSSLSTVFKIRHPLPTLHVPTGFIFLHPGGLHLTLHMFYQLILFIVCLSAQECKSHEAGNFALLYSLLNLYA